MYFKKHIYFLAQLLLLLLIFSNTLCAQSAQRDSIAQQIKLLNEKTEQLKAKDSVRIAVLQEQLSLLGRPTSKEVNKYKKELESIRRADSLHLLEEKQAVDKLRDRIKPLHVTFFTDTVFKIYTGLGPFSAEQRVKNAHERIVTIYEAPTYFKDSLHKIRNQDYINISYGRDIITSISAEDALWENVSADSLANSYLSRIDAVIVSNKESHNFQNNLYRWLSAVGVAIGFIVVILLLNWAFRKIFFIMARKSAKKATGFRIRNYQFISPGKLRRLVFRSIKTTRAILQLLLLYIAISIIFSIFPATRNWAYLLIHWLKAPLYEFAVSVYHYLPNLVKIIVILIVTRYIDKFLHFLSDEVEEGSLKLKGFHREWARPTYQLIRICLYAFSFIIIFPYLPGSDTTAFRGISVFFGILLSLGSSSAISNTIAGFVITYMRPFKVGDWIKINDTIGRVIEKTALVTRLRTIANEDITVPNSMILSNKTTNYSSSVPGHALLITSDVNVSYNVPFNQVEALLLEAAYATSQILQTPKPFVLQKTLKDTYASYQVNAPTMHPENMYFISSELNHNIRIAFERAGVELLAPQFFAKPEK